MKYSYDIIIIGGGITGSILASQLSKLKGLSILILEAADDRTSERVDMSLAYAYSIIKSPASPFNKNPKENIPFPDTTAVGKSNYYRYADKSTEFKSTYLKIGGGTTWHWLGNVPRFLPNDFKLNSLYGVGQDWPIGYADIKQYYDLAEKEIGVSGNSDQWRELYMENGEYRFPMPEIWPTYGDTVLKRKLDGLDIDGCQVQVRSTPQARNSESYQGRPACAGNSSCVPICPIGAKYDASVHLKKSIEEGVEISYKSVVIRLEKADNGNITKVWFENWERVQYSVDAKIVIVACHAIESALLLQYSDVSNSSGMVGRNLMDHPQGYGVGLSNEPLFPFRGPPTTSGIDVFRDGVFRRKHSAFRISLGNDGWGRWQGQDKLEQILSDFTNPQGEFYIGKELKAKIAHDGVRIFRFSYSTEMLPDPDNRVIPHETDKDPVTGMPLPKLDFQIDRSRPYNQYAFEYADEVLKKMFTAIGTTGVQTTSNLAGFSGAGHIMGTTRMGENKESAVVNADCQSFDHPNLFIIGPGVFPTCGTANPTLTATALALRLADFIKKYVQSNKLDEV